MPDPSRHWWLAWTDDRIALLFAVLFTVFAVFFTLAWILGQSWFSAAVYILTVVFTVYSWWNLWYLTRRRRP